MDCNIIALRMDNDNKVSEETALLVEGGENKGDSTETKQVVSKFNVKLPDYLSVWI